MEGKRQPGGRRTSVTVVDCKEGCRFAIEFVSEREDCRVCVLHGCEWDPSQLWSAHAQICQKSSGGLLPIEIVRSIRAQGTLESRVDAGSGDSLNRQPCISLTAHASLRAGSALQVVNSRRLLTRRSRSRTPISSARPGGEPS